MRLFLAIELSDAARKHLAQVQDALRQPAGKASWTRPENLHLTLKFLGEVPDAQVPALCDAMKAARQVVMQLVATGLECFPNRGPVRIIGARIEGDLEPLRDLAARIEQACFDLGFPREARDYKPHITLARARSPIPGHQRAALDQAAAPRFPGPTFAVDRFLLMQSLLEPRGARYQPLAHFDLSPAECGGA